MVKRYDMEYGVNKFYSREPQVIPVQSTQGAWVTFEDYAALAAQTEDLKARIGAFSINIERNEKMGASVKEEIAKLFIDVGENHLRQVRADAGRAGYIKGANEWCEFPYENSPYVFNAADQYANRVREVKND